MIVDKRIEKYVPEQLNIVEATLLSIEEAELVPIRLREYHDWWWLRSPGDHQYYAANVRSDGDVDHCGDYVDYDDPLVRPALVLQDLDTTEWQIGDRFILGGKQFEIISHTLAFCTTDIGKCAFNYEFKEVNANDYYASDVRLYVDEWFKKYVQK